MDAELAMDIAGQTYNATNMTNISSCPSANTEHAIVAAIHESLEAQRLDLPTLPDMAIKIQELIDDPDVSADKIVNLLSTDPAISAYIIKAANSAALSNATRSEERRVGKEC